jgi:hypothetical protein
MERCAKIGKMKLKETIKTDGRRDEIMTERKS